MVSNNQLILFITYYSAFSAPSAVDMEIFCADRKFQSKMNQLCKTKPIFKNLKIIVTLLMTMTNSHKLRTVNRSKRTQTNPILVPSEVEGSIKTTIRCGG